MEIMTMTLTVRVNSNSCLLVQRWRSALNTFQSLLNLTKTHGHTYHCFRFRGKEAINVNTSSMSLRIVFHM